VHINADFVCKMPQFEVCHFRPSPTDESSR
jgi:hypothetical protein